ncbi:MAG: sigma 54-interacting transcriptional regulator [Deltaproteobacteria bacterium]|nr:sigma 54-interacting transcriptional regulator [Deltaproteobacteria bacterium]
MPSVLPDESFSGHELELLHDVSASIQAFSDLNELLRHILRKIKTAFDIEGASIALHDPAQKEFFFIRTVEEETQQALDDAKPMRFPDHYGVAGWVFRKNRSVIIPDVENDERFANTLNLQQRFQTRSMICVPLNTAKERIGVLYALNKREGTFTEHEARLLEVLAGPIAISIENARLYGELKQHADHLASENVRLQAEVQNRFNLQGIIGSCPAMEKVFNLVEKVINTTTSVLIQGETGTGKEMIARVIHYSGPLRDNPFVAENCGALSENLLESELFGHVKGAFTGAVSDKKGLFEMADGGTVFLDEIADMPPAMQIKLLRVLQEGQVRPVGGSQVIDVNFRLIASSNRDLYQEVSKGRFRDDLFYRVQVFPIFLPPLRDRREDIPLLASHFLDKCARKFDMPVGRLKPTAMEMLSRFNWPGNIRELENEIERSVCLAGPEQDIGIDCLSEKITAVSHEDALEPLLDATLQQNVAQLEKKMIIDALRKSGGNRSQAARTLGLTRQGLLNKIGRYKVDL